MEQEMLVRVEKEDDWKEVERITRQAFWNLCQPGTDEHFRVHQVRQSNDFIRQLSLVLEINQQVVAHILYSRSTVHYDNGQLLETITFGPVSVDPNYQNRGIGTKLVRESLVRAKQLNYKAVVMVGPPLYYSRFGFKCSKEFGIKYEDGQYYSCVQALELEPNYLLKNSEGTWRYTPSFNVDKQQCEEFDKQFPPKQKYRTVSQQVFEIASTCKAGEEMAVKWSDIANMERISE